MRNTLTPSEKVAIDVLKTVPSWVIVQEMIYRMSGGVEDVTRDGLKDTPQRVVRAWKELFSGYAVRTDEKDLLKTFDNEDGSREMVVVRGIEFTSWCEHHLMQFDGVAHVAYLPGDKIVGLSKFGRLVDIFSRRFQNQERLTDQIAKTVWEATRTRPMQPAGSDVYTGGAACVIEARHTCMSCRGVRKQNSTMVTSSLYGAFKDDPKTRAEFLALVRQP